ncbi:hypothetical protein N7520_011772 [Penicillium odoratum]|uniref:uncharacterized protein n=1 Tax=Penicillium odoratum TaxID=1167516 RepID=UPI002546A906|nr:uncharacterized protein N7520_011772 [Penicillium odoratum]KAJ5746590.1 hypothetical protein N7520_011772 [Penicillium odoratum]
MTQIAIITGGTSGIGLDIATRLDNNNWKVHIIGTNIRNGESAASKLNNSTFHQADVSNYNQQATVFDKIFTEAGRLDFVFANAGIAEKPDSFYSAHDGIPPEPKLDTIGINLNGIIHTSYLALHYFRRSPSNGARHLVLTASIGGLYPCANAPIYSATKHAMVGFTRSVGKKFWEEGVKVNAICPGVVETPLLTPEIKSFYGDELVIPMPDVTDVVMEVLSGNEMVDSKGMVVSGEDLHSRAILISGKNHYFVEMPEIYDVKIRITHDSMMM